MGLGDPGQGSCTEVATPPTGHPDGCFSNCPTCRRLRKAAAALAARVGVEALTSEAIAARAMVPLERALEHYPTLDDCLAATYDEGTLRIRRACVPALRGSGSWRQRLRAAVDAGIEEFQTRPELARFCILVSRRSDLPMVRASRVASHERFVAILAEEHGLDDSGLPPLRFEMLAGAAQHVLSEASDTGSLRLRMDQVIAVFVPEP